MRPSSYVRRQSPYALRSTAITPLRAAKRTGPAPVVAQLACGGWNYIHDTASQGSLRKWCETIGANGWRLEEFQHFYGNATFDDAATPSHYGGGRKVVIAALRATYEEPMGMSRSEVADLKARSPLSAHDRRGPPDYFSMSDLSVDDLFRDADLSLPTVTPRRTPTRSSRDSAAAITG
ncbi:hypothetical protein [Streptomyces sp. NBC_01589]|uniref:hypothetical protein n=1 Tax=unclassified Streptomyces TaxID=2593676 RepID=UPI003867926F